MYGDPIDGKMLLLRSADKGLTWVALSGAPHLEKGEASFAASGTGIRCTGKREVIIATGGLVSRLWKSSGKGDHWVDIAVPVVQGQSTAGIFSFIRNNKLLIVVGGDFQKDSLRKNNNFYSTDGGQQWIKPAVPIRGYRECVERVTKDILIATGPSGTDISYDNSRNWKALADEKGLHVVRKARRGSLLIAAGNMGQVYILH